MANHVTNILTVEDGDPTVVWDFIKPLGNDDGCGLIDFNRLIPMPDVVRHTGSGWRRFNIDGEDTTYNAWYSKDGNERPLTDDELMELAKIGHSTWYDWANANWGTKWNAYDQSRKDDKSISFQTAWNTPARIWEALSKRFPSHTFRIRWADEDFGSNVGNMSFRSGNVISEQLVSDGSPDACRLAADVIYDGKLPDYMKWNEDGTVEYVDDEEPSTQKGPQ